MKSMRSATDKDYSTGRKVRASSKGNEITWNGDKTDTERCLVGLWRAHIEPGHGYEPRQKFYDDFSDRARNKDNNIKLLRRRNIQRN